MIGFLSNVESAHANLNCQPAAERSNFDMPVVVTGPVYFIGNEIGLIGAYAFARDKKSWNRIPIQVDERNSNGDLVLSEGLPFTKATDNGIFDQNDEVITNLENWGDDFKEAQIPSNIAAYFSNSWKLHLCSGRAYAGTILIGILRTPNYERHVPPVKFDLTQQFVGSQVYRYQFNRKRAALLGQVFLKSGGRETAVFESSNFRMPLVTPWYAPDLNLSDDSFVSEIESWQEGPLRTVVAVGVKFRNFLSIFDFHMFSELVFYKSSFQIPTKIEFKFDPKSYLKPGSGIAYAVKLTDPKSWSISTNLMDLPLSAEATQLSTALQRRTIYTAEGRSADMNFAMRVMVDPKAASQTSPPYFISAATLLDQNRLSAWQGFKGLSGDLGIFIDFSGVSAGLYDFGLDLILGSGAGRSSAPIFEAQSFNWSPIAARN